MQLVRRFTPLFDGIDGVPAVLLVVPKPAVKEDPRAHARKGKSARAVDFGGSQRAAGVRQTYPPVRAVAADPDYAPHDGDPPRRGHTPGLSDASRDCTYFARLRGLYHRGSGESKQTQDRIVSQMHLVERGWVRVLNQVP